MYSGINNPGFKLRATEKSNNKKPRVETRGY